MAAEWNFSRHGDAYELLGLSSTAPAGLEVRRAYRRAALLYHPDKGGEQAENSKFLLLSKAVAILECPAGRKLYDERLAGWRSRKLADLQMSETRKKQKQILLQKEAQHRASQQAAASKPQEEAAAVPQPKQHFLAKTIRLIPQLLLSRDAVLDLLAPFGEISGFRQESNAFCFAFQHQHCFDRFAAHAADFSAQFAVHFEAVEAASKPTTTATESLADFLALEKRVLAGLQAKHCRLLTAF